MSYLAAGKVDTLQIQPLVTHKGETGRRTTITAFRTVLQKEEAGTAAKGAAAADGDQETPRVNHSGVIFRDPATGRSVRYVEAGSAEDTGSSTGKTVSKNASASRTTSASSMKTTKYDTYFKKAAQKYGVPESLLKGIAKAESNFNARDLSSSGAMGVMQLMPETARGLGVTDPYDPEQNIMGGAKCIAQKLKEFNGNVEMALAAYNAGSGAVRRAGGIPAKCRNYIRKVLSYQKAFETAQKVG